MEVVFIKYFDFVLTVLLCFFILCSLVCLTLILLLVIFGF